MSKELVVSSNRHETRVAILEDDQLVEIYFQRQQEYSLAGSIHKGRVTRVLPGMQSAFVDIGLERDAFLYVSDFFEDNEEYEQVVGAVEEKVLRLEKGAGLAAGPEASPIKLDEPQASVEPEARVAASEAVPERVPGEQRPAGQGGASLDRGADQRGMDRGPDRGGHDRDRRGGRRPRRRRGRGRGFPESKYASPNASAPEARPATGEASPVDRPRRSAGRASCSPRRIDFEVPRD